MDGSLSIEIHPDGGDGDAVVIAVAGEIDMATAAQLDEHLSSHGDRNVVLDLSGVGFLDSSGLTVLVKRYRALRDAGYALRTTGEPDNVRATLQVTGLLDLLHPNGTNPNDD